MTFRKDLRKLFFSLYDINFRKRDAMTAGVYLKGDLMPILLRLGYIKKICNGLGNYSGKLYSFIINKDSHQLLKVNGIYCDFKVCFKYS